MSSTERFEENLISRVGILNGFLRRDQLVECLEENRASSCPRDLGQILLQKGYLTEEQLDIIQEIRRKKVRKMLWDTKEIDRGERAFGQIALRRGLIQLRDLETAILEQERLRKLNLQFRIGEILVSRGLLPADRVLEILAEQRKRVLHCTTCDFHYQVFDYKAGDEYHCKKCGGLLSEPFFLDSAVVDGVIDMLSADVAECNGGDIHE